MKRLTKDKLVEHFNYNEEKSIGFCKTCVGGKHHRTPFTTTIKTTVPLELVHSDVCGNMQHRSLGGAEYFLAFTDDHTRDSWVYILKTKNQVFKCFHNKKPHLRTNQAQAEMLKTDNGGEYTSKKFGQYLKDWDLHLDSTPDAYRIAKHDPSRFEFSPIFLMYNCHPQMAIDHEINSLKESIQPVSPSSVIPNTLLTS